MSPTVYGNHGNYIYMVVFEPFKSIFQRFAQAMTHTVDFGVVHILELIGREFVGTDVEAIESRGLVLVLRNVPFGSDVHKVGGESESSHLFGRNFGVGLKSRLSIDVASS